MRGVWSYAAGESRRRAGGLALLAVVIGLVVGSVLSAAAGARRTTTALPRLRAASVAADALVQYPAGGDETREELTELREAIGALPGVERVGHVRQLFLYVDDGGLDDLGISYGNYAAGSVDGRYGTELERGRVLHGVRPAPDDPASIALSESAAARLGLGVGDEVELRSLAPEQLDCLFAGCPMGAPDGITTRVRIGSVERFVAESFGAQNFPQFLVTPAYLDRYGAEVVGFDLFAVRLRDGLDGLDALTAAMRGIVEDRGDDLEELFVTGATDTGAGVLDATAAMAAGIQVVALIIGGAGLVVVAQAIARQLGAVARDAEALRAVGLTRHQRAAAAGLVVAPAIVGGVLLSVLAAVLASAAFPLGRARAMEPSPGIAADGAVLVLGAATALVVLAALTYGSARRTPQARGDARAPGAASRALAAMPAPVAAGVRAGLLRGPGGGLRVQAIGGTVVAVALVLGAGVFASSLDRFVASPARDGWNWDLEVTTGLDTSDAENAADARRVAEVPGVAGVTAVRAIELPLGDESYANAYGLEPIEGAVGLTLLGGRGPAAPGEVALGSATARQLDVGIGDRFEVDGAGASVVELTVVGIARLPVLVDDAPDLGMWVTLGGLRELGGTSDGYPTMLVTLAEGADAVAVEARLLTDHAIVQGAVRSTDTINLAQLAGLPRAAAAVAVVLGAVALAHALVTGVRRRHQELAVLRTLGFTARQVGATVHWQALAVVVTALAAGAVLGTVAGQIAWSTLARSIGAAPDPSLPLRAVLVVPVGVLVAVAVAWWPARAARRIHPAVALRRG